MTVTLDPSSPQYVGPLAWRLSWTSDLPGATFYVYRDGVLIATTTGGSIIVTVEAGETPLIEVYDDASTSPMESHPGRIMLAWCASSGSPEVNYYRVDEYIGAAWVERARLRDDGRGYFTWRSRQLEDCTSHQFRIVPVGDNANEGAADTRTILMVRHPDPPEVSYTWDSGTRTITVSAA